MLGTGLIFRSCSLVTKFTPAKEVHSNIAGRFPLFVVRGRISMKIAFADDVGSQYLNTGCHFYPEIVQSMIAKRANMMTYPFI